MDSFHKKHNISLHGKKIIILDDIREIALVFKKALELSGLEVILVAHTGEEMLAKLHQTEDQKIDFALMDYNLKGGHLNGLETAKLLQMKYPDVRVIMLSADESVEMSARSSGFYFLKKPIGLAELLDTLD